MISSEVKTDSGSAEPSVPLDDGCSIDASKETLSISSVKNDDLPVEPKLSVSVDSHVESKLEESIVPLANEIIDKPIEVPTIPSTTIISSVIPNEPKVKCPGKESVSVNSISDTNLQVANEMIGEPIEVPAVLSSTIISSVIPSESKVNSHSDTNVEEIAVQNGDGIKLLPSQEDVHTNSMVDISDVQKNGCKITEIPSNNTVSSDASCEHEVQSSGIESVSVESHIAVKVKESSADVILETGEHPDKDDIQFSGGKEGSCEREMNTEEKEKQKLETS